MVTIYPSLNPVLLYAISAIVKKFPGFCTLYREIPEERII